MVAALSEPCGSETGETGSGQPLSPPLCTRAYANAHLNCSCICSMVREPSSAASSGETGKFVGRPSFHKSLHHPHSQHCFVRAALACPSASGYCKAAVTVPIHGSRCIFSRCEAVRIHVLATGRYPDLAAPGPAAGLPLIKNQMMVLALLHCICAELRGDSRGEGHSWCDGALDTFTVAHWTESPRWLVYMTRNCRWSRLAIYTATT